MKTIILALIAICVVGCVQTGPVIQITKPYEGHYYNTNEIQAVLTNIELLDGESVWILSNTTLKRVLKNN